MKKSNKKSEKTLGILAHLQKNIPAAPMESDEEDLYADEEDEDEMPSLLSPKKPQKLMSPKM